MIDLSPISVRYAGYIDRAWDWDHTWGAFLDQTAAFIQATAEREGSAWIEQHLGSGPCEAADAGTLSDEVINRALVSLLQEHVWGSRIHAIQCEACGRMHIDSEQDGRYRAFHPDGKYQGTLEPSSEGFVRYLEEAPLFGATLIRVTQHAEIARVHLAHEDGREWELHFDGVTSVRSNRRLKMRVRYLSEWKAQPPQRGFRLDGWKITRKQMSGGVPYEIEGPDAYLEITARSVEVVSLPRRDPEQPMPRWVPNPKPETDAEWHILDPLPDASTAGRDD